MAKFEQCLRPVFTEQVWKRLDRGESLNVLTADEAEADRLFADLQAVESSVCWVRVSFRAYSQSFAGFLEAVWRTPAFRDQAKPETWAELVGIMEQVSRSERVWVWFDRLDRLFNSELIDPLYDQRFVDSLNALRNDGRFALVGVTPKKLVNYTFYVGGMEQPASVLELAAEPVPSLSAIPVRAVLSECAEIGAVEREAILRFVLGLSAQRYGFLLFVVSGMRNDEYAGKPIEEKLRLWKKAFFHEDLFSLRKSDKWRHRVLLRIKDFWKWINVFKLLSPVWNFIIALVGKFKNKDTK